METQNKELEVMRQQLAILNKKLDSQEIVNNHLMREIMKNKMSWIRNTVWAETIACPFIILLFISFAATFNLSYGPVILMTVMLVADVVADYKINMIGNSSFLDGNLVDTAIKLAKMKRSRLVQTMIEVPVLIVWVMWFLLDMYRHTPSDGFWNGVATAGFIGGVVGFFVGVAVWIWLFRKMQHTNDEVIHQIEELHED